MSSTSATRRAVVSGVPRVSRSPHALRGARHDKEVQDNRRVHGEIRVKAKQRKQRDNERGHGSRIAGQAVGAAEIGIDADKTQKQRREHGFHEIQQEKADQETGVDNHARDDEPPFDIAGEGEQCFFADAVLKIVELNGPQVCGNAASVVFHHKLIRIAEKHNRFQRHQRAGLLRI